MPKINISVMKTYASGRWLQIFSALATQLSPACEQLGRHVPCPEHGGIDGFRLFNDASDSGGGICNTCGSFADGLAVLQWANSWTFQETLQSIASYLGLSDGQPLPPKKAPLQHADPEIDWSRERQRLEAVWKGTITDNGRIAEYLHCRGLNIEVPPTLRLHPNLTYFHQGPFVQLPCMVAQIIRNGEMVGLHRTWLDPEGPGKATVSQPKKTLKCAESMSGGAIQLFQPELYKPLTLCEGIETGLAIRELTGFPVWPCTSLTMLEKVQIPERVHNIYIGADKDKSGAGQRAAKKLAQRLWDESKRGATISLPPGEIPGDGKSFDWNDYVAQGSEAAHV